MSKFKHYLNDLYEQLQYVVLLRLTKVAIKYKFITLLPKHKYLLVYVFFNKFYIEAIKPTSELNHLKLNSDTEVSLLERINVLESYTAKQIDRFLTNHSIFQVYITYIYDFINDATSVTRVSINVERTSPVECDQPSICLCKPLFHDLNGNDLLLRLHAHLYLTQDYNSVELLMQTSYRILDKLQESKNDEND